ncbi:MAG: hypothetical protein MRJ52_05955 [Nitrosomonas sp.]|nr:hypothetical protein [Nitrosomonas sp.]
MKLAYGLPFPAANRLHRWMNPLSSFGAAYCHEQSWIYDGANNRESL